MFFLIDEINRYKNFDLDSGLLKNIYFFSIICMLKYVKVKLVNIICKYLLKFLDNLNNLKMILFLIDLIY